MWSVFTSETMYVRVIATFLAFGIVGIGLTESIRATNHRENSLNNSEQEPKKPPPPPIDQKSSGDNSPNTSIIGDNNTVINSTDPKVSAKLDEIKKLLQKQQGNQATQTKLLQKYPLGYVIFDIDQKSSVFPYGTQALLEQWDFDWSTVKLAEDNQKILWLTLPNVTHKGASHPMLSDIQIGGQKRLGQFDGVILEDGTMRMMAEILAIRPSGIVFLIGFDHAPKVGK